MKAISLYQMSEEVYDYMSKGGAEETNVAYAVLSVVCIAVCYFLANVYSDYRTKKEAD